MSNIKIFCTSTKYYKIIDKLPNYIYPLGLGNKTFPSNWYDEKKGKNITNLNSYYGELTGIYWIWKNMANNMNENEIIGNCHYRKLWLDELYEKKQKLSYQSLYKNLLKIDLEKFKQIDAIQVQPVVFKKKNLLEDFFEIHKSEILYDSLKFLDSNNRNLFLAHLKEKTFYPLNMFITKVSIFNKYCETLFPWLEKCLDYCLKHKLCKGYNTRLPAFLAERFTSFWFSQNAKKINLSYARLGNFFLSNKLNNFINPTNIPFTFRMYPTLHKY